MCYSYNGTLRVFCAENELMIVSKSSDLVISASKDNNVKSDVLSSLNSLRTLLLMRFMQLNDLSASAEDTAMVFLSCISLIMQGLDTLFISARPLPLLNFSISISTSVSQKFNASPNLSINGLTPSNDR